MDLKEFYTAIGGDYDGTLARLLTDERIRKFVIRFKDDPSYNNLYSAIESGDLQAAFLAAHTLKGVSQNLGFEPIYRSSSAITEILRAGSLDVSKLLNELKSQYITLTNALSELE